MSRRQAPRSVLWTAARLTFLSSLLSLTYVGAAQAQNGLALELPGVGRTSFQLTSTTLIRYRGENYDVNPYDDDFFSIYQRLDLSLQAQTLRLESRIDAFVPFVDHAIGGEDCPSGIQDDSRCYLDWDLRPERLALRWDPTPAWTLEAGDTQLVLGRGVALSFRKVDLLGVDNALRGAHAKHNGKVLRFQAHGGIANPQNQDPINLAVIEDPEDVVLGGSIGARIPNASGFTAKGQAVRVWFEDDELAVEEQRAVDVFGGTLEVPALLQGKVALYAEGNVMRRTETLPGEEASERFGRGIYGSAQLQLDRVTLLFEWKDYTDFLVAPSVLEGQPWRIYNAAPAVEYDGPQRLRGIGNQRGGGVRFDYAFLPGPWAFSVNSVFYGFSEEVERDPWDGIWATHSWVGIQRRPVYTDGWTWSFNADVGARFEVVNQPTLVDDALGIESGDLDRSIAHGRGEFVLGYQDHAFDLTFDHRFETERAFDSEGNFALRPFEIGGTALTYSYGIKLAFALGLLWTDFQPGIVERREERDYIFDGRLYPSLETRWTFTPGTFLSVFVGQTPGGQICSGGICRDVPPYEGVNVQFVGRI
ncbi:MAG: hypothetical protein AAGD10_10855 [Myxococcota bacterium]